MSLEKTVRKKIELSSIDLKCTLNYMLLVDIFSIYSAVLSVCVPCIELLCSIS